MARPFLTARWEYLTLFTFVVPRVVLLPYLPSGLTLDERDGQTFVSLVGFRFRDTRVFGISWPGFRQFPELNLRCYVRYGSRRGVLFIREIVASSLICLVARLGYNEPYVAAPLRHEVSDRGNKVHIAGELTWQRQAYTYEVTCQAQRRVPPEDSIDHFFKEHQWGFGRSRNGRLLEYEVRHPCWRVLPVTDYRLAFDFGAVYGPSWAFLNSAEPISVLCAEGSAVRVFPATHLPNVAADG